MFYDREQNIEMEFNQIDGFNHYRIYDNSYPRVNQTSEGFIVMSDEDGISIFDPQSLKISKGTTTPVITGLKVNNHASKVSGDSETGEFATKENVSVLKELVLDYAHNNFSIEFSAMEMTAPEKNIYRHRGHVDTI